MLLTFDDGPSTQTTELILKFLSNEKIKALFFCVGKNAEYAKDLFRNLISEGHTIGNHSFNHKNLIWSRKAQVRREIESFNDLIKNEFNYKVNYFRPPYGRFDFRTQKIVSDLNMKMVLWSLFLYDYKNDSNLIKLAVNKYLKRNSIIVLHDNQLTKNNIIDTLKIICDASAKKGFEIGEPAECLR
jgi:peptidoglycan/xylan/chitin deacetylase (PgdA/CDA1 family)